jgi:PAS domain S-box-containing protein
MTQARYAREGELESTTGSSPVRVLHVDTQASITERTTSALEATLGEVDVVTADDAADACEQIAQSNVECVVTSDRLPDADATTLLRSVREEHPTLPVVVFTERTAPEIAREVISTTMTGYVQRSGTETQYAELAEQVRDLLVRARERRRLERVEDRYRKLVEESPTPIAIVDANARFASVNGAGLELLDADDESDLRGRSVEDVIVDDDRSECQSRLNRVLRKRETTPPREVDVESLAGERKHTVWAGVPVNYEGEMAAQVMLNDVTAHTRLERKLRRQRDRFSALFRELPEPVVEASFADGSATIERVNPAFEDTFDVDSASDDPHDLVVAGSNGGATDLVDPDTETDSVNLVERARNGEHVEIEVTRETADGERDFLLRVVPFSVDDEQRCYVIYVDISELIERERQLQRQNDRLEEFASVLSHDLRNPLMVAQGTVEMLDVDETYADRIERAHDRMERLIEDVLTLAREGEVTETQAVSLSTIAERARQTTETNGHAIEIDTDHTVDADPSALREIFENLFRNAVEHGADDTDDGVTVRVEDLPDGFAVADDGVGIAPDEREKVFESGYSTVQDNTGFGLRIVRQLVTAHGWDLELTESDAGGARFEITGAELYD